MKILGKGCSMTTDLLAGEMVATRDAFHEPNRISRDRSYREMDLSFRKRCDKRYVVEYDGRPRKNPDLTCAGQKPQRLTR